MLDMEIMVLIDCGLFTDLPCVNVYWQINASVFCLPINSQVYGHLTSIYSCILRPDEYTHI